MNLKQLSILGGLGAGLAMLFQAAPAAAQDEPASDWEFSANVALTSDYVYRGFTQSDEGFAIQGGFDLAHSSGFYVGVWGSSVDFNDLTIEDDGDSVSTSLEIDVYGGYGGTFGNSIFSYDVGVIYYMYPNDPDGSEQNFVEFGATLGADFGAGSVSLGAWWSPDFYGGIGDAIHVPLSVEVPIPIGSETFSLTVGGTIAYNKFFDVVGDDDYLNWDLGFTVSIEDWFDVDLRYYDTDGSKIDCDDLCDERFVVTVSREF